MARKAGIGGLGGHEIPNLAADRRGRPATRNRLRVAALAALLLALVPPPASSGQQEEPPVFRTGGLTVVIDAVVTDGSNAVVADLSPSDFEVLENGRLQSLDSVVFQRNLSTSIQVPTVVEAPPDLPAGYIPKTTHLGPGVRPVRNLIVFLLDFATTEYTNQKLVQDAAIRYVEQNLTENDYVAVFGLGAAFGLIQDFTNHKGLLISALQVREMSGKALAGLVQTGESINATASQIITDASTLTTISADTPQGMAAAGQEAGREGSELARLAVGLRIQRAYMNMGSFVQEREARGVLTAIRAIAQGMEDLEGRKTLILFSQGFIIGPHVERALESTIAAANRANVAVYSIDSQGLVTKDAAPGEELYSIGATQGYGSAISGRRIDATGGRSLFDRAKEVGSDARDSALRFVSVSTGGFAIRNTNDLHLGLRRIDQDIRSYYLLTYRPANQEFDGTFREVTVRVKRPGVTVRHRSGYLALPPGWDVVTGEEYRLVRAAESGSLDLSLPAFLRLETFSRGPGTQQVLVNLEVLTSGLQFSHQEFEKGRIHQTELEVIGIIRDVEGNAVMRFGTPMTYRFTDEEFALLQQGGLSFNNKLDLAPGIYSVQVLVRDQLSGKAALVEQALRVAEAAGELSLSSIVLAKDVQKAAPGLEFLTVGESTVLPTAVRKFRNGENLIYYLEVYNAGSHGIQAELALIPSGSQNQVSLPALRVPAGTGTEPVVLSRFVELQGLAPGIYFLEARVHDGTTGKMARGRTSLEIVR